MKIIRTIADIEELKEMGSIPLEYVSAIELEFIDWFEAAGTGELLMAFELSDHTYILHLDNKQDTSFFLNQIINIEFVEKEELSDCDYFRIGIRNEHQMNLVYFLGGTLDQRFEEWLGR